MPVNTRHSVPICTNTGIRPHKKKSWLASRPPTKKDFFLIKKKTTFIDQCNISVDCSQLC